MHIRPFELRCMPQNLIRPTFLNTGDTGLVCLVYWGLTPQQQPGSYQGGETMMESVFWWRKPEYPEETTDLRQVTDETFHTYGLCPVQGLNLGSDTVMGILSFTEPFQ